MENSAGLLVTENIEMAEELNQFFTSVSLQEDTTTSIPQLTEKFEQSTDPIVLTKGIRAKEAGLRNVQQQVLTV